MDEKIALCDGHAGVPSPALCFISLGFRVFRGKAHVGKRIVFRREDEFVRLLGSIFERAEQKNGEKAKRSICGNSYLDIANKSIVPYGFIVL